MVKNNYLLFNGGILAFLYHIKETQFQIQNVSHIHYKQPRILIVLHHADNLRAILKEKKKKPVLLFKPNLTQLFFHFPGC